MVNLTHCPYPICLNTLCTLHAHLCAPLYLLQDINSDSKKKRKRLAVAELSHAAITEHALREAHIKMEWSQESQLVLPTAKAKTELLSFLVSVQFICPQPLATLNPDDGPDDGLNHGPNHGPDQGPNHGPDQGHSILYCRHRHGQILHSDHPDGGTRKRER